MTREVTHVGFSDESNWNKGRFRSLGLVTVVLDRLDSLNSDAQRLLKESSIREFKWKDLQGAKERFAAEKLCKFTIENALEGYVRVDVLIWDIEDSRHKIPGRDDIANLGRMYYHLFHNVLRKRWPKDAVWRLHPDEHTAMDWGTLQDCLQNASVRITMDQDIFTGGKFRIRLQKEFGIEMIQPVSSLESPILQIADLFAGLAVFSHERFKEYQKWLQSRSPQQRLFGDDEPSQNPSRSSRERFEVLSRFDELCKSHKLGMSLKRGRGLWTPKPSRLRSPLNFWIYKPQHSEDKAPVR